MISLSLAEKNVRETELEITRRRVIRHDRLTTGRDTDSLDYMITQLEDLLRERKDYLDRLRREQG